jgi:hypothetical protein
MMVERMKLGAGEGVGVGVGVTFQSQARDPEDVVWHLSRVLGL